MTDLIVSFIDEEHVVEVGAELTFGRSGQLAIDDNKYLHRILGRFSFDNGVWWLSNVGGSIPMTVSDSHGPSFAKLAPGSRIALTFESSRIAFEAGGCAYEVLADLADGPPTAAFGMDRAGVSGEVTTTASSLPMSTEQRLLLVALAEAQLRDPSAALELPTNRQVAHRLGWTITKYNRKLDGLCVKFAAAGVSGLVGSVDSLARDRRVRLVDHAIHAGVVTPADLAALDAARP